MYMYIYIYWLFPRISFISTCAFHSLFKCLSNGIGVRFAIPLILARFGSLTEVTELLYSWNLNEIQFCLALVSHTSLYWVNNVYVYTNIYLDAQQRKALLFERVLKSSIAYCIKEYAYILNILLWCLCLSSFLPPLETNMLRAISCASLVSHGVQYWVNENILGKTCWG